MPREEGGPELRVVEGLPAATAPRGSQPAAYQWAHPRSPGRSPPTQHSACAALPVQKPFPTVCPLLSRRAHPPKLPQTVQRRPRAGQGRRRCHTMSTAAHKPLARGALLADHRPNDPHPPAPTCAPICWKRYTPTLWAPSTSTRPRRRCCRARRHALISRVFSPRRATATRATPPTTRSLPPAATPTTTNESESAPEPKVRKTSSLRLSACRCCCRRGRATR